MDEQTAVVEAPEEVGTAAQRLAVFEAIVSSAQQRLAALAAAQDEHGMLSLEQTTEQLALERWLVNARPQLEKLQHGALYAQAQLDVVAVKDAHDAFIPEKQRCYDRIQVAVAEVFAAFQALAVLHDTQVAPLLRLTWPGTGEPAIPVRTGSEVVQGIVSRMPAAQGWSQVLLTPTSRALTRGDLQQMQDADPGLQALNPRVLERYLEGLRA